MNELYGQAFLGGIFIGLAALVLLLSHGRIAGISGILGATLRRPSVENGWRYAFIGGLLIGGAIAHQLGMLTYFPLGNRSRGALLAAGLLVGIGAQLGSGCTSGHGVCGIGRFSFRSIVATLTFMFTGALTVYLIQHMWGSI